MIVDNDLVNYAAKSIPAKQIEHNTVFTELRIWQVLGFLTNTYYFITLYSYMSKYSKRILLLTPQKVALFFCNHSFIYLFVQCTIAVFTVRENEDIE